MYSLGRLIDAVDITQTTFTKWVALKRAGTITIFAIAASTTGNITVEIAQDASGTAAEDYAPGSAVAAEGITTWHVQQGGVWAKQTQAAAATVATTTGSGDITAIQIDTHRIPDGFDYITAKHANAKLLAVLGDLEVQRAPENLSSLIV
jgi:hypothetical protein